MVNTVLSIAYWEHSEVHLAAYSLTGASTSIKPGADPQSALPQSALLYSEPFVFDYSGTPLRGSLTVLWLTRCLPACSLFCAACEAGVF